MSSTVNRAEIEKFDDASASWWDTDNLLHKMNATRVPFIRDGILEIEGLVSKVTKDHPQPLQGIKILDAGCGGGILAEGLAKLGATVVGVDVGPNLIKAAQAHAKLDDSLTTTLTYLNTTLEEHAQNCPNHYDAVVSSEVVEHVNNRKSFIGILAKLTKPGGSVFITTINRNFKSLAIAIILMEHVTKNISIGTHSYNMLVKPEELKEELQTCQYNNTCAAPETLNFHMYTLL